MLINDEPVNKKFKVLDIAIWYKVVICLFTEWGGYFVQKLLVIKHGMLLTEQCIYWGIMRKLL